MDASQVKNAINISANKPTINNFILNFESFAAAPNGINKLKALILEMATSGNLTERDDSDDDVNKYVSDIYDKRNELVQLKKTKFYNQTGVSLRGNLPDNWACLELGEVFVPISVGQNKIKTKDVLESGEFPVVDQGKSFIAGYSDRKDKLIKIDSPVIVFGDHTKALKLIDFDFIAGADGVKILLPLLINPEYFFIVLKSYSLDERDYGRHYKILLDNDFPLPSIQEQKRIVAKVDELMALCDQLEAQQQQQANTLLKANTAAIQALLPSGNSKDDLKNNWQRLADNFHTLYGNAHPMPPGEGRQKKHLVGRENVNNLRKLILNLAVTGKIISDIESKNKAEDLFVEIQNYRNKLIEQGKLKKPKIHNRIVEADVPCELPKEWKWVRLGDIFDVTSSKRVHAKDYVQSGVPFFRSKEIGELGRGQDVATELFISQEQYDSYKDMPGFPSYGDLMLCSIGASIGNNWLCDDRAFYYKDGNITKIGAHKFAEMRYLKAFVDSDVLWQQVTDGVSGSAYNALTIIKIKNLYYPMPPLEEQKRIVVKVDELMLLCDQLEQQLTKAYDDAEKLIIATTKALVA